jgi:Matrixin
MRVRSGPANAARRRLGWGLLAAAGAALVAAVAVGLNPTDETSAPGPLQTPADARCVAEPGAEQQDVDTRDSPESPWEHVPGQEITVYFANEGLPSRYSALVEEGAALWSRSPCIEALAVEECPDGARCSAVVAETREYRRGDHTDGESEGVDRQGVRYANTIRLYTNVLDRASDNGALATVVHEIGHALGLVHRNDPDSVMNAVTGDHTDPVPDATDFANLVVIYGAAVG